jgi:hypothetical protein
MEGKGKIQIPLATLAFLATLAVLLSLSCGSSDLPPAKSAAGAAVPAGSARADAGVVDEGPPVNAPPGWRRFVAEDEGFTLYMPGTPITSRGPDKGPSPILRATYKDHDTGCIYAVSYNELDPSFIGHADELFAKLKDDPGPGLTLLRSDPVPNPISPEAAGRDLRFVDSGADTILAMRVYAVEEHYYVVAVTFPRALYSEDAARTYLDTFRLTATP